MRRRKIRRHYGLWCMVAIMITGALVTAGGFVMRRTVLKGLPQYDGAPDIALPMMLLQDSSPVREARERAAWEAENGEDVFDDELFVMDDDEAEDGEALAELVDSFEEQNEADVMSVFNGGASAQGLVKGSDLPSLEQLMSGEKGVAVAVTKAVEPTAEPFTAVTLDRSMENPFAEMTMDQVADEPINAAAMDRVADEPIPDNGAATLEAQATLEPMETLEPEEPQDPEAVQQAKKKAVTAKYFRKTLFIGDSRTNGLQIWGRIGKAHYFCGTGYSVFNITQKKSSDAGHFKDCTLAQVLKQYKYNQIYIMLGFNEAGYPYSSLMKQYKYIISQVHKAQPKAKIILHGVMHTSYKVACRDKFASLKNLERINDGLRKFANSKKYIYYVDCNDAFCDENGYLKAGTSSDGEHLNPKYTKLWAKEIIKRAI